MKRREKHKGDIVQEPAVGLDAPGDQAAPAASDAPPSAAGAATTLAETTAAAPEAGAEAAAVEGAATPPAEAPSGLEGVDVSPLPPATREELEALRRERDELGELLLRKRAEFENYRRRVERERQQAGQEVAASLLRSFIPTLDNLERALRAGGAESGLREGIELIHRNLVRLLEGQGVVALDPIGERFDPLHHQALAHEHAPGFEEGTVVEVLQKGYFFKDRLLRPALVKVAKGGPRPREGEPEAIH